MPELDGVVEPIVVGAVYEYYDDKIKTFIKKYLPIDKHVKYFVKRCLKWIELRRKSNYEKRIAIILHNNPCAGAELSVGMAFGLDSFESLVRLLHKLKELGYNVGEKLPRNGKELAEIIKSRKALPEFRWTPVEEIVAKGGYVDLLPLEEYLNYFEKLPEQVKMKVIKSWGDPKQLTTKLCKGEELKESDIWTKLSLGLYGDKIVIPGLKFGNVVILPQPKRGCAGPRCDGKVCKILHEPDVPPPHQWLAVYYWIENVFKTDVIIHFGTHGYLEFLPGKMCGLSWTCFPEISISALPHIYVYAVSNPMEGVIAKRRSYATLVNHSIPVMAGAKISDELKKLEDLVEEYQRAKYSGSKSRIDVLLKEMKEIAHKLGWKIDFNNDNEFVEYIHERIHQIKDSLFREGLHILGKVPEKEELAKFIVSIMRIDLGNTPSIRKFFAKLLGLDYEDLISNPTKFNTKFNMSNSKVLELIDELCVKFVTEILRMVNLYE